MKKLIALFFISLLTLSACGPVIYMAPDAYQRTSKHQLIAILPPKITLRAQKNVTADAMAQQIKTESLNFQNEMYKSLLRRKSRGEIFVDFMDVEEANAIIQRNFPDGVYTNSEVCKALGVDGTLSAQFGLSKPMSQGAAIATLVLFGAGGATNEVTVNLSIKDCTDNTMFWNYDWRYSGGLGTSPEDLVEALMRNASRKMPYNRKS
jgi:hypothetical protein